MNLLELFAGSRSIGKAAEALGFDVFSSDIEPFPCIDYPVDILEFDVSRVPFIPDVIWASPPCTTFSIASCGTHWKGSSAGNYIPATKEADLGLQIVHKTLEIIDHFQPKVFFIENPRGLLRKMPFMQTRNMIRYTVTYCQYGDSRMKPTDIFCNIEWHPKPSCRNGDPCHEAAPRGSKTGTQGIKGAYGRSVIPAALCSEIMTTTHHRLLTN